MIAAVTVLAAFALGYLLRSRAVAHGAYAIAYLWAFVFQTLYLLLDSLGGGDNPAFRPGEFPLSYGVLSLAVFVAGFGLVAAGRAVRDRRARRAGPAPTTPTGAVTG